MFLCGHHPDPDFRLISTLRKQQVIAGIKGAIALASPDNVERFELTMQKAASARRRYPQAAPVVDDGWLLSSQRKAIGLTNEAYSML